MAKRYCRRCKEKFGTIVEISQERMAAVPETELCVECSKEVGGEIGVEIVEVRLDKGGIKQNKVFEARKVKKGR